MKRTATIITAALALAACQDMGLEGNAPLDEAVDRPASDLVAAVYAPTEAQDAQLIVDGRLWVPSGGPLTLSRSELEPVGASGGRTVYARSWDEAPYDQLFTRLDERGPADPGVFGPQEGTPWQVYEPVIGRSGAVPAEFEPGTVPADADSASLH